MDNPNRCRCGKIKFVTLEDAETEAARQLALFGNHQRPYRCHEHFPYYHLTTETSYLKSTQLVLGELQNRNILVAKCLSGSYLLIRPHKTITKMMHNIIYYLDTTRAKPEELIFVIAKYSKNTNSWLCMDPWVQREIPKHQYRTIHVSSEVVNHGKNRRYNSREIQQQIIAIDELLNDSFQCMSHELIRILLKLREEDVVHDEPTAIGPIYPTPPKEKERKERTRARVKRFLMLTVDGLAEWDKLVNSLPEDITISDMVTQLITEENRRIEDKMNKK